MTKRWAEIIIILLLIARYLAHTWKGLFAYFRPDDMMNLYYAWLAPIHEVIFANLTPFTNFYRPLCSAVYRLVFFFADFNPVAFRAVTYAAMIVNVILLVRLAQRISGSIYVGALAGLIGSYHHRLFDLYTNNGTLYDVFCYLFTLAALLYYLRVRGARPTLKQLAVFYALMVAALNSKEMAVVVPVLLLAYELIYHPPALRTAAEWMRWLTTGKVLIWVAVVLSVGASAAKLAGDSPFAANPGYELEFSWTRAGEVLGKNTSELFNLNNHVIPPSTALLLHVNLILIAALFRSRDLWFAAALALIAPLPVLFIPYRGFFVWYLPLAGWAIYLAVLLRLAVDRVAIPRRRAVAAAVFLAMAWCLYLGHAYTRVRSFAEGVPGRSLIYQFRQQMLGLFPTLPGGARLVLLQDPFGQDMWQPVYIISLTYNHRDLTIHSPKMFGKTLSPAELQNYDYVLDYSNGRIVQVSPAQNPSK